MIPTIDPAVSHLLIAFAFAVAGFCLLRWLVARTATDPGFLLINTLCRPLLALPWVLLLFFSSHFWPWEVSAEAEETIALGQKIVSTLYLAWVVWEFSLHIQPIIIAMGERWQERLSYSVIARTLQLLTVICTLLSLAQVFGYSLSTLLAFGGIGGIILGLAARDWLANFFGGLMLMLDRPFAEGDWVRSPDRAIEGHVEKVGWRLTKIRTFDRRPIYVPNSIFTGIVVENASRMRNRRTVENFALRYEDVKKMPRILSRIDELAQQVPGVDSQEPHYAVFLRYDEYALVCQVRVHIKRTDRVGFLKVQEAILLLIARVVTEEGASFAYPTRRILANGSIAN